MATTASYGNIVGFIPDALRAGELKDYVASALHAADITPDTILAATDAYRDALNEALAQLNVVVSGTEVYGPYPRVSDEQITEVIENVDFWEAVSHFL